MSYCKQLIKKLDDLGTSLLFTNLKTRIMSGKMTTEEYKFIDRIISTNLADDSKLSAHVSFGEMTRTTHRELIEENKKSALMYLGKLKEFCTTIIEPARALIGSPVYITSGFRCDLLNKAVGGSFTSQHVIGEAGDIEFLHARQGKALLDAFNKIAFSDIPYSQIILEFGQWIHIGLIDEIVYPGKVGQKMIASKFKGQVIYTTVTKPYKG